MQWSWGAHMKWEIPTYRIMISFCLRISYIYTQTYNSFYQLMLWEMGELNTQTSFYQNSLFDIRSDQISCSIVSDSLPPHELQHARPPCPSPTPRVHSDSGPSSQWCHPAISSSVVPFSSCPQSLLASESFPMSQPFTWGGQSTGVSALASFFPKKSQGWSPSEWTGWISLQSKGHFTSKQNQTYFA